MRFTVCLLLLFVYMTVLNVVGLSVVSNPILLLVPLILGYISGSGPNK